MELVRQQNEFTIRLKELEDGLLQRLANAEGDILADEELIISLEETKATVGEINEKKAIALKTTKTVEEARESFTDCGTEEERCVRFFEFVYEEVATPQKRLRPLKMRSGNEKKMAVAERYDIDKTDAVDSDAEHSAFFF